LGGAGEEHVPNKNGLFSRKRIFLRKAEQLFTKKAIIIHINMVRKLKSSLSLFFPSIS
jgi:hypothetical protein